MSFISSCARSGWLFLSAATALSNTSAAKSPRISSISIYAGLFVPGHTAHSRSFGVFCAIGSSRFCRLAAMMRPFISASREIAAFDLPRTDQAFLIKTDQIRSACQTECFQHQIIVFRVAVLDQRIAVIAFSCAGWSARTPFPSCADHIPCNTYT